MRAFAATVLVSASAMACSVELTNEPTAPTLPSVDVPLHEPTAEVDAIDSLPDAPEQDIGDGSDTALPSDQTDATELTATDLGPETTDGGTDLVADATPDLGPDSVDMAADTLVVTPTRVPSCVAALGLQLPAAPPDPCASPDLGACWAFEGDLTDGTGNGNTAAGPGASYGGGAQGQALASTTATDLSLPHSASTQPNLASTDVWFYVDALPPSGQRYALFDDNAAFSFYIYDDGVRGHCGTNDADFKTPLPTTGEWNHVACVGGMTTTRLYLNGDEVLSRPRTSETPQLYPEPTIGIARDMPIDADHLVGRMDTLRIWSTTPTPEDICLAAVLWDGV